MSSPVVKRSGLHQSHISPEHRIHGRQTTGNSQLDSHALEADLLPTLSRIAKFELRSNGAARRWPIGRPEERSQKPIRADARWESNRLGMPSVPAHFPWKGLGSSCSSTTGYSLLSCADRKHRWVLSDQLLLLPSLTSSHAD